MRRAIDFFINLIKQVPLLPITILSAIPFALLQDYRPWQPSAHGAAQGVHGVLNSTFNPSVGQYIVVILVVITVVDAARGMIDDLRHGRAGVDILAIIAILSTLAVQEYWASWAVVLMVWSGDAIEAFAQSKAESNLSALASAAPQIAHIVVLPGVGAHSPHEVPSEQGGSSRGGSKPDGTIFRSVEKIVEKTMEQVIEQTEEKSAGKTVDKVTGGMPGKTQRRATGYTAERVPQNTAGTALPDVNGGVMEPTRAAQEPDDRTTSSTSRSVPPIHSPESHLRTVQVEEVGLGDVLAVLPGETIPVDGKLLSGSATLDLSNINGEPVPREVYAGALVMSGAINGSTVLTMRTTQLSKDSQYQRILELVSSARDSRAQVVKTADRLAVPFTVISLLIAGIAWMLSGSATRFAQVLVLATPCPLLIAAPVAYMAGTGRLAKSGILIKTQEVLERLGQVSHIFFDKTGTLTVKKPQVVRVDMMPSRTGEAGGAQSSVIEDVRQAGIISGCVRDRDIARGTSRMSHGDPAESNVNSSSAMPHAISDGDATGNQSVIAGETTNILGGGVSDSQMSATVQKADASTRTDNGTNADNAPEAESTGEAILDTDHLLMLAGVVETYSVHILAQGIAQAGNEAMQRMRKRAEATDGVQGKRRARAYPVVKHIHEDSGNGVSGEINGLLVKVGRLAYVTDGSSGTDDASFDGAKVGNQTSDATDQTNDATEMRRQLDAANFFPESICKAPAPDEMVSYVSINSRLMARIVLRDVPRSNAEQSIMRLRKLGIRHLTMLTGDKQDSAQIVANEVGIDDVYAELLPEDKLNAIMNGEYETGNRGSDDRICDLNDSPDKNANVQQDRAQRYRAQRHMKSQVARPITMMVGDGVNDAPVLAAADIGMAITDGTSTAASQSAQVVIMNDDIGAVPTAISIARRTRRVMLQAIITGLGLAVVGMVLAAFNLIPVVVGAFLQEAIDVVSILWALTALIDRE